MTFAVHHICADLHSRTNMFEADAKHYLWKLAELKQFGFEIGTLPMLQMHADSRALRVLADAIDAQRNELTKQTELT
jgi:hypothetical protein